MADKVVESVAAPEVVEKSPMKKVIVVEETPAEEKKETKDKPVENGTNGHSVEDKEEDDVEEIKEIEKDEEETETRTNGTTEAEKRPVEETETSPVKRAKVDKKVDTPEEEPEIEEVAA